MCKCLGSQVTFVDDTRDNILSSLTLTTSPAWPERDAIARGCTSLDDMYRGLQCFCDQNNKVPLVISMPMIVLAKDPLRRVRRDYGEPT